MLKKPLLKFGKYLVTTTMALSVLTGPVSWKTVAAEKSDKTGKHEVQLRILGTTDIHTQIGRASCRETV